MYSAKSRRVLRHRCSAHHTKTHATDAQREPSVCVLYMCVLLRRPVAAVVASRPSIRTTYSVRLSQPSSPVVRTTFSQCERSRLNTFIHCAVVIVHTILFTHTRVRVGRNQINPSRFDPSPFSQRCDEHGSQFTVVAAQQSTSATGSRGTRPPPRSVKSDRRRQQQRRRRRIVNNSCSSARPAPHRRSAVRAIRAQSIRCDRRQQCRVILRIDIRLVRDQQRLIRLSARVFVRLAIIHTCDNYEAAPAQTRWIAEISSGSRVSAAVFGKHIHYKIYLYVHVSSALVRQRFSVDRSAPRLVYEVIRVAGSRIPTHMCVWNVHQSNRRSDLKSATAPSDRFICTPLRFRSRFLTTRSHSRS